MAPPLPLVDLAPLGEQSDAALFARVAARDRAAARDAEAELYRRHVRYLYGVLVRRQRRLLALAGVSAEDLVQETFHRAFERAATFVPQAQAISDPDRERQRTRAWLGRIARNLLADAMRKIKEVSATPYLEQVSVQGLDVDPDPSERPELERLREALHQLSEREQDVLRVTALYYRAGEHQRLPNSVAAELAARWSTSSENVRAIRSRALRKLRQLVSAGRGEGGA